MTKRRKIGNLIKAIILWGVSILVFIPLLIIVFNSLKTQGESVSMRFALPTEWVFSNYSQVMEQVDVFGAFRNSLIISVSTVLIATTGAALASFVISRRKTKLHRMAYFFFPGGSGGAPEHGACCAGTSKTAPDELSAGVDPAVLGSGYTLYGISILRVYRYCAKGDRRGSHH